MNNQAIDHNGNEIEIEAFHPGEYLREEIEERVILKKDAAKSLGILPHHLSEIFVGKRNISATIAVRLEKLLGISFSLLVGFTNGIRFIYSQTRGSAFIIISCAAIWRK